MTKKFSKKIKKAILILQSHLLTPTTNQTLLILIPFFLCLFPFSITYLLAPLILQTNEEQENIILNPIPERAFISFYIFLPCKYVSEVHDKQEQMSLNYLRQI